MTLYQYLDAVYSPDPMIREWAMSGHDFWPWNSPPAEETQPRITVPQHVDFGPLPQDESEDDPDYDDSKDHTACTDCNPNGKGRTPGWYQPLVGPPVLCDRCDGAGWV